MNPNVFLERYGGPFDSVYDVCWFFFLLGSVIAIMAVIGAVLSLAFDGTSVIEGAAASATMTVVVFFALTLVIGGIMLLRWIIVDGGTQLIRWFDSVAENINDHFEQQRGDDQ